MEERQNGAASYAVLIFNVCEHENRITRIRSRPLEALLLVFLFLYVLQTEKGVSASLRPLLVGLHTYPRIDYLPGLAVS